MQQRRPINRASIVQAAAAAADSGGLPGVSMRRVGRELGVEAMSLYHHIANKDELLDALVDLALVAQEVAQAVVGLAAAEQGLAVGRALDQQGVERAVGAAVQRGGLVDLAPRLPPAPAVDRR